MSMPRSTEGGRPSPAPLAPPAHPGQPGQPGHPVYATPPQAAPPDHRQSPGPPPQGPWGQGPWGVSPGPGTHRVAGTSRVLVPVLAITSVLLLVVGFGVQAAARGSLAEQDATLAALRRQRSADAARTVLPGELPRPAVNVAALRVRLAAVTAADRDVDASVKKWVESDTKLSTVWDALERCMYRVDQYDRLAGRFSAAELGDLPVTIDTSAAASDCGRAAITRYAAGSSL